MVEFRGALILCVLLGAARLSWGQTTRVEESGHPPGQWHLDAAAVHYAFRSETLNGAAAMPQLGVGLAVTPSLVLRVEVGLPTQTFTETRRARYSLAFGNEAVGDAVRQLSRRDLEQLWPETDLTTTRDVRFTASVLAGYYGAMSPRVRVGLLAGFTLQREQSQTTEVSPTLVDLTPTYSFRTQELTSQSTQVLVGLGIDVEVRVAPRFAIVPQLRLDFGPDANDPDDRFVVTRPAIAARWWF